MAVNVAALASISCQSAGLTISSTSEALVLSNPLNSGQVLRIISLRIANTSVASVNTTVRHHAGPNLTGQSTALCFGLSVPVAGAQPIITRDIPLYLQEGTSLGVIAAAANALDVLVSYEVMS